jgi:hypothetical protein
MLLHALTEQRLFVTMGTPKSGVWDNCRCIYGELAAYIRGEILSVVHPMVTYSGREGIAQALL